MAAMVQSIDTNLPRCLSRDLLDPRPRERLPRAQWDAPPPTAGDAAIWESAQMVELPPDAWFLARTHEPCGCPGLLPWTGTQPLSRRERAWVARPVLSLVLWAGYGSPRQLAVRAQS
ncbi:hypothetical protein Asppvi_005188 [Aspergillus pseudoviridinutans]|uniref:Uncharacterized protein n=1 Tax=Aspergillus pseudoviridinutans TaxID=1517512 RepID=A0A9P3BEM5_9EURO|nr:uncharacterized protein Asppvi_005188 [Aspergillus pseudoviridinutans]GIJ86301.1 hypothetical protein Asppvi_005188 [Aspergillus pseudoviridinutans]